MAKEATSYRFSAETKRRLKALAERLEIKETQVIERLILEEAERRGINQMQEYGIDLSGLTEEQKGDVSQRLHELQQTCFDVKDNVGNVYGSSSVVNILQREGWDVKLVSERAR